LDLAKIRKKARTEAAAQAADTTTGMETPGIPVEPELPAALGAEPSGAETSIPEELPPPQTPPPGAAPAATAAPPADAPQPATGERPLIFDLASEKYAIPIHDIAQIIDLPPFTPVPNGPPFLAGIFSLRGRIVSVIDAAIRLGLDRSPPGTSKVVVLDLGSDHLGLLVDRIDQVVEVNLAALEPAPEGFKPLAQDFVEGVFHHKERAVGFLNLPMFLAIDV
jgi:purine-binding chemotaxis protein CheW